MVVLKFSQGTYSTQHNSPHLCTQGRVDYVTLVWSFVSLPYPTLPYIEASTHPYRGVCYIFLLQYPTIPYPVIYSIGLHYPYVILHHSLMHPIEIVPGRPRADTT